MPPSSNHAYCNIPGRGRILSSEAREFKEAACWLAYKARKEQGWQYEQGSRLCLTLILHFSRNGKRDLSNRIKLVEDALAQTLGFDDSVIDMLVIKRGKKQQQESCLITLEEIK